MDQLHTIGTIYNYRMTLFACVVVEDNGIRKIRILELVGGEER